MDDPKHHRRNLVLISIIIIIFFAAGGVLENDGRMSFPFVSMHFDRVWVLEICLWIIFLSLYWRYKVWLFSESHEGILFPADILGFYRLFWSDFLPLSKVYKAWSEQSQGLVPKDHYLDFAAGPNKLIGAPAALWPIKDATFRVPIRTHAGGGIVERRDIGMKWSISLRLRAEFILTRSPWIDYRAPLWLFRTALALLCFENVFRFYTWVSPVVVLHLATWYEWMMC